MVLTNAMPIEGEYEPSSAAWVRDQVEEYEGSGGTRGTTLRDTGLPVVIITNLRGALRKGAQDPADAGRARRPVRGGGVPGRRPRRTRTGTTTSVAHPEVELQDGPVKRDYVAREVTGDERAEWWKRAVAAYPPYAEYQERTARDHPGVRARAC